MKKIIVTFFILFIFYVINQIIKYNTKAKTPTTTKNIQNLPKQNKVFLKLYQKNKEIDHLLLEKYKKKYRTIEKVNYEHSYTPTKLLDKRVRVHINLDNDLFKDNLGL